MDSEKLTRCFIAIDLPKDVVKEIERVQDLVKKQKLFIGKFTESENLHLTLKFLGEIDKEKVEEVKNRLREIKINQFEAKLGKVGVFSSKNEKNIRIIWVELLGKSLFQLQKEIDKILEGLFEKEKRFMSHVTIARIKHVPDKKRFLNYMDGIKIPEVKFIVKGFSFKKSELDISGPVYTDLEEYNLD